MKKDIAKLNLVKLPIGKKFKLMDLEYYITNMGRYNYTCITTDIKFRKMIDSINSQSIFYTNLYTEHVEYFIENRNRYLFILSDTDTYYIIEKKSIKLIPNSFLLIDDNSEKLIRFIKYHLIKENLYE